MTEIPSQTFSSLVKCEIAALSFSSTQKKALLASFIKSNGIIRKGEDGMVLDLSSEYSPIAELLYQTVSEIYRNPCRYSCVSSQGKKKTMRFHVIVSRAETILEDMENGPFSSKIPSSLANRKEEASAYVAGAFLASGYVNDPKTSNYHLEFSFGEEAYANRFLRLLNKVEGGNFLFKLVKRRNQTIVYIKRSEKISEFLVFMGASQSCLMFESIRIDRDFANIGNRLSNLDKANESKKNEAAARQIHEMEYLLSEGVLDELENPKIGILCEIRLSNPEASMDELAEMLSEEMGMSVSKSNVNHLFRTIHSLYEKKKGEAA